MSAQGFGRATLPQCSPDFNVIENVFGIMVERMANLDVTTMDELYHSLRNTVKSIHHSDISYLYSFWRDRLAAVIEAQGGPTRFVYAIVFCWLSIVYTCCYFH